MLEVLVAIVIVAIGLLGLAGLHVKMQQDAFDAYQRSQALILLQDMADRILANRDNATDYASTNWIGKNDSQPSDCGTLTTPTQAQLDICEWSNALKGAAETLSGADVGAMINATGCIRQTTQVVHGSLVEREFGITVAWQGTGPTSSIALDPDLACTSGGATYTRWVSNLARIGTI